MEEGPPEQANKTLPFCRLPFLKRSKIDLYFPTNVNIKQDLYCMSVYVCYYLREVTSLTDSNKLDELKLWLLQFYTCNMFYRKASW